MPPSEKEIPGAVDRLAESIRQKLALPENVIKELKASSFQPSSKSIDRIARLQRGHRLAARRARTWKRRNNSRQRPRKIPTSRWHFPGWRRAYSSLGYDSEAEQSAKKAVELSQDLPEAEKYLISAIAFAGHQELSGGDQGLRNPGQGCAGQLRRAIGPGQPLSGFRRPGESPRILSEALDCESQGCRRDCSTWAASRSRAATPQGSLDPLNRAYSLAAQVDNQEQKATSLHLMAVATGC